MRVENRNLFRLIRCGAFGNKETLEPMSAYKWQHLFAMALHHQVAGIIMPVIKDKESHPDFDFPQDMTDGWEKAVADCSETEKKAMTVSADEPIHFTNGFLNNRLQKILDEEVHSIDTNVETLYLLKLYVTTTSSVMGKGIRLSQLVRLGKFLREKGDKVDYVKFERWIGRLRLRRMTALISTILIRLLGFSRDEFPFISDEEDKAVYLTLLDITGKSSRQMKFSQGASGFVVNDDGKATLWNIKHNRRLLKYHPIEAFSNFFHKLSSSLSEIEE